MFAPRKFPLRHPNGYVQDAPGLGGPLRIAQPYFPLPWAAPTYQEEDQSELLDLALGRALLLTRHVTAEATPGDEELLAAAGELREAAARLEEKLGRGRVTPIG